MLDQRKRRVLAIGLAAFLGVAGGCGDDDDEPATAETFIEEADAVCQEARDRHPQPEETGEQAGAVRASKAAVARLTEEERGLRALEAPEEHQSDFDAFLRDTNQMQQLAVTGQGGAESGNQALYNQALEDYRAAREKRASIAERIGFSVCGGEEG